MKEGSEREAIWESQAMRNRLRDGRKDEIFSHYFTWFEVSPKLPERRTFLLLLSISS